MEDCNALRQPHTSQILEHCTSCPFFGRNYGSLQHVTAIKHWTYKNNFALNGKLNLPDLMTLAQFMSLRCLFLTVPLASQNYG